MLTEELLVEIKVLARQGRSIRAIARELGIARNTVRSYLRGDVPNRAGAFGRPRKLAPFEDWLRRRVDAAQPLRLPATVLHRELQAIGYSGTERTVQRFIKALYPLETPEPAERFETPPGHQAQMDWGEYRLNGQKIYAFVGVLGHSRWMYVEYVESTQSDVLIECHRRMFGDFGGVPHEILYDNMRTVVSRRDAYGRGRHRFHDALWSLAAECGFRPRLCRPYRPQTKGKVERSVHYVESSFFNPLITRLAFEGQSVDLDLVNAEARQWVGSIANQRIHGTTGERPRDRLETDREAMSPYRTPETGVDGCLSWPRYTIQRSPKTYDAILEEATT
ncbi:MAG: IS21 family transposase [Gammaproteobacteria bacterium]|nr:IS21 family transposase [Gammaproteobacteria bacterium]